MSEVGFEPTIFRPTSAELEPAPLSQFGYSLLVARVGFEPTITGILVYSQGFQDCL
jgi:hypothetical protein